jgi:hypothetical protein
MPVAANNLEVASGREVTLSLRDPDSSGGKVIHLRPKTPRALRTLAGLPSGIAARLDDDQSFEIVDDVSGLVSLVPDSDGRIQGIKARMVKTIIQNLDDTDAMPRKLQLPEEITAVGADVHREFTPVAWGPARQPLSRGLSVRRAATVDVMDWMLDLRIFTSGLLFSDITVRGELIINSDVSALSARNFSIHDGGKVSQRSEYLVVTLSGEMKGL